MERRGISQIIGLEAPGLGEFFESHRVALPKISDLPGFDLDTGGSLPRKIHMASGQREQSDRKGSQQTGATCIKLQQWGSLEAAMS